MATFSGRGSVSMVTDDPVVLLQLREVKGRVRHKPIWKSNVREYGAHRGGEWRRRSASIHHGEAASDACDWQNVVTGGRGSGWVLFEQKGGRMSIRERRGCRWNFIALGQVT
jgi:hypothetical protein